MKLRRKDDSEQGWHWEVISTPPDDPHGRHRRATTARLTEEERDHIDSTRLPNGHFAPGVSGFPGGSVRKAREDRYFIDALKDVFEGLGGVAGMLAWATTHQTKFYEICSKLMPVQLNIEREQGNNTITIKHAFIPKRLGLSSDAQSSDGELKLGAATKCLALLETLGRSEEAAAVKEIVMALRGSLQR